MSAGTSLGLAESSAPSSQPHRSGGDAAARRTHPVDASGGQFRLLREDMQFRLLREEFFRTLALISELRASPLYRFASVDPPQ
jgi:hypothetical protein